MEEPVVVDRQPTPATAMSSAGNHDVGEAAPGSDALAPAEAPLAQLPETASEASKATTRTPDDPPVQQPQAPTPPAEQEPSPSQTDKASPQRNDTPST